MTDARAERRLAAILAGDIVGYSRLMGADEEGTLACLNAVRREFWEPKIAEYRGRIVKRTSYGVLIEFASVVQAASVDCVVSDPEIGNPDGVVSSRRQITGDISHQIMSTFIPQQLKLRNQVAEACH
jgi:adenylate cyclase